MTKLSFVFEHDGVNHTGIVSVSKWWCSLQIEQMPNLEFRLAVSDEDKVALLLPTDRVGKRARIACSVVQVPILGDAIPAALSIAQRIRWNS